MAGGRRPPVRQAAGHTAWQCPGNAMRAVHSHTPVHPSGRLAGPAQAAGGSTEVCWRWGSTHTHRSWAGGSGSRVGAALSQQLAVATAVAGCPATPHLLTALALVKLGMITLNSGSQPLSPCLLVGVRQDHQLLGSLRNEHTATSGSQPLHLKQALACLLAYTRMTESLSSSSSRIACRGGQVL